MVGRDLWKLQCTGCCHAKWPTTTCYLMQLVPASCCCAAHDVCSHGSTLHLLCAAHLLAGCVSMEDTSTTRCTPASLAAAAVFPTPWQEQQHSSGSSMGQPAVIGLWGREMLQHAALTPPTSCFM